MSDGLPMWVIYERPRDFPEHFVVRRWRVNGPVIFVDQMAQLAGDIEAARALVPPGLYRLPPYEEDDPVIREVWL